MVVRQDMVALVTGASRGLGLEAARLLARRGARLIITARGVEALRQAAAYLAEAGDLAALPGDVADPRHAERLVALGMRRFGRIDLVVNNASTLGPVPMPRLEALPLDALDRIFRVNVSAPLRLMQLVLPQMRARSEGTIVNVTSDAAVQAYPGWGGYGVSKAALEHLSRVFAAEVAGSGIRVYVVDPGEMNTQMYRDASPGTDLTSLPGPERAAARLVDLVEYQTEPFGRFELQAWKVRDPQRPIASVEGA